MKIADKKNLLDAYDKYAEHIYRFAYLKIGSQENAQDLTSEAFLRCLKYLEEGKEVDNFRAFLYQVMRNLIVDFYRQNGRISSVPIEDINEVDSAVSLEKPIAQNIDIENALKRLKDDHQEVIILYYLEGLPIAEMSVILSKNEGAVRVSIHRALNALKEVLK